MKKLISGLLLSSTATLVSLLLAEGVWRMVIDSGDQKRIYHTELERTNIPSSSWTIRRTEYATEMRTNSDGFRGPEMPRDDNKDELRILFLGDSFVEAKQVEEEERFVEQIEQHLSKQDPVVARAIAVGGSAPSREFLYYQHLGLQMHPDIVIQVLFPENDLETENERMEFDIDQDGNRVLASMRALPPQPCNLRCGILRNSKFISALYRTWRSITHQVDLTDPASLLGDYYWYTVEGQDQLIQEERYDVLAAAVSGLRDAVEQDEACFLTLLMPGALEIEQDLREEYVAQLPSNLTVTFEPHLLLDRTAEVLTERGIHVIDLRPAFLETEIPGPYYFRQDPHLTAAGHDVVTKKVIEILSSEDFKTQCDL